VLWDALLSTGNGMVSKPYKRKTSRFIMKNPAKKFLMVILYGSIIVLWQSSCRCKQDMAAKEAFFAPGSIKFKIVNK
jgi:hypothetical protein